jgi:hypothetical protein
VVTGWAYQFPCTYDYWQVPFWWQRLMQDTVFENNIKCRWESLRSTTLSNAWFNNYVDSVALVLEESQQRNFIKWPILGVYVWPNPQPIPTTYAGEIQALKSYLQTRLNWLDQQIPGNCNPTLLDEKQGFSFKMNLQPNPASESVVIETHETFCNNLTITILDMTGKTVATFEGSNVRNSTNSYLIDVRNIPAGIWIVKLDDGQQIANARLVISK